MIRNRLAQILDTGGLSTRVQPIMELQDGGLGEPSLYAVECLTRGPVGTVFEAAHVLFDYARRKQAEVIIDRECLSLAMRSIKVLPLDLPLFLNVHASTLARDKWFVSFLEHQAEAHDIELRRLTLEILEYGHTDGRLLLENVQALRKLGVKIALDDIGLHYCNFGMLLEVAPEFVKLDLELVRGCHTDPRRQAIVRSLNQIGLDVGAKVVAEGVEGPEELLVVTGLGVRYIQGFHFLPPVRPEEFLAHSCCAQDHPDDSGRSPSPTVALRLQPPGASLPISGPARGL